MSDVLISIVRLNENMHLSDAFKCHDAQIMANIVHRSQNRLTMKALQKYMLEKCKNNAPISGSDNHERMT